MTIIIECVYVLESLVSSAIDDQSIISSAGIIQGLAGVPFLLSRDAELGVNERLGDIASAFHPSLNSSGFELGEAIVVASFLWFAFDEARFERQESTVLSTSL